MVGINTIGINIIIFILGNVSGFLLHAILSRKFVKIDQDTRINYLIFLVSIVWFISVLVDIATPTYQTSPFIHGIMGAIVGFFFYKPKT